MDSSGPDRVGDDSGSRPNSPASVDGGQASHASPMNDQRLAIERMEKYRPMDFLGKKDDGPFMAENWLERTERMLRLMHCTLEENLECATSLL